MEQRPFAPASIAELSEYISRCTVGTMEPSWASLVLTEFIAGPEAVCDLWHDDARVGLAVSIDTCETEGNAAELSIFCARPTDEILHTLMQWGETRAASAGRHNVDIPEWPGTTFPRALLEARGYQVGHIMYDMQRLAADATPIGPPRTALPDGWRWEEVNASTMRGYYDTVRAAYAGIPSAFVAPYDDFCEVVTAFDLPPALLLAPDPGAPVAGFIRVERKAEGRGRLASLGRHPAYRGRGLGEHIVGRGIDWLGNLGRHDLELEVAATNASGIALYESFGFVLTREMTVFRCPV